MFSASLWMFSIIANVTRAENGCKAWAHWGGKSKSERMGNYSIISIGVIFIRCVCGGGREGGKGSKEVQEFKSALHLIKNGGRMFETVCQCQDLDNRLKKKVGGGGLTMKNIIRYESCKGWCRKGVQRYPSASRIGSDSAEGLARCQ